MSTYGRRVVAASVPAGEIGFAAKALARASTTMAKADMWWARLAVKTLRRDQREAIAEAVEG